MQSGIGIGEEIRNEFQNLRMRRKHRYIIYKPSDDQTTIQIEKLGDRDASFEEFKESMPKASAR